jgi:hypothetical protein
MANPPVLVFDWKELPHIADNIWQAQMAGWERVLTYRGPLPDPQSRGIRKQTMTFEVDGQGYRIPSTPGDERDEYPFTCTEEGAKKDGKRKPWVGAVPSRENHVQGGMLSAFIKTNNITAIGPNRTFEVQVKNHPRGPVIP